MAQPFISYRSKSSVGAPLPTAFWVKSAKGNSSCCQPVKSSEKAAVQRWASSVVDPGFRFSSRSMNRLEPEFWPYIHRVKPA